MRRNEAVEKGGQRSRGSLVPHNYRSLIQPSPADETPELSTVKTRLPCLSSRHCTSEVSCF
jgi:hypothetical protein